MTDKQIYAFFAKYIHDHTGINYPEQNFYQLTARLEKMAKFLGVNSMEEVYQAFQRIVTPDMNTQLLDLATNNETFFFRDETPFNGLAEVIMPSILESNQATKSVSIWSAACSTGQEPYSIIMTIRERVPQAGNWRLQITATDISTRALAKAREGAYTQLEVQRGLPIMLMMKYFTQNPDNLWQIKPEIRQMVKFNDFNLIKSFYPRNLYDVVFCRNVLIYQKVESRREIVNNIHQALRPGGFLVMGSGENLLNIHSGFDSISHGKANFYKKKA